MMLDASGSALCPFCRAGIAHQVHVPASRVRVGPDYGDSEPDDRRT